MFFHLLRFFGIFLRVILRNDIRVAVALIVLPAVLAFGFQSSLELFHPIEEARSEVAAHDHFDLAGPSLYDSSHGDPGDHEHHYCPHSNALAYLAGAAHEFGRLGSSTSAESLTEGIPALSVFAVQDRGPPAL